MSTPIRRSRKRSFSMKRLHAGFRNGRAASCSTTEATAGDGGYALSKAFSAASVIEPRESAATSGESLTQSEASTVEASPIVTRTRDTSRQTRQRSVPADAYRQADLRQGGREAAQISVLFGGDGFSSTDGQTLGLTVSPGYAAVSSAANLKPDREESVGTGARIQAKQGGVWVSSTPLRPGDILADINGQDVRRLSFHEVLRLLNEPTPTPLVVTTVNITTVNITTTTTRSPSHAHPYPLNAPKNLRGPPSAAALVPRTLSSDSGHYTAPPSTNRSIALMPSTPPSPAALAPLPPAARPSSPRRFRSIRTPRAFAPLLTDVRRVSWRRKSKWGGGGREDIVKDSRAAAAAASFFSSPAPTPTHSNASPSSRRAASLNPWGGGTPGGKPKTMTRARSMVNTTFSRISPWLPAASPRAAEVETFEVPIVPPLPSPTLPTSPDTPAAAPPSPTGDSPLQKAFDSRSASSAPGTNVDQLSLVTPVATHAASLCAEAEFGSRGKLEYSLDSEGVDSGGEADDGDRKRSICRQLSMDSTMSFSSVLFPLGAESDDDDGDDNHDDVDDYDAWAAEEEEGERASENKGARGQGEPLQAMGASSVGGAGKGEEPPSTPRSAQQDARRKQTGLEVPLREREEEEIVALSSYLACAGGRGWPWSGKDVVWAEYVSLNGHHRWIRTQNCRHALLLVHGALYLLELPTVAATRYQTQSLATRAPGSWYVKLDACDLSHVSVPLTRTESTGADAAGTAAAGSARARADRFEAGSGLIFHKRGGLGACAWVECRSAASRDALVDQVSAWVRAAQAQSTAAPRVELRPVDDLLAIFGGERGGRKMPSLTNERQACPLW